MWSNREQRERHGPTHNSVKFFPPVGMDRDAEGAREREGLPDGMALVTACLLTGTATPQGFTLFCRYTFLH